MQQTKDRMSGEGFAQLLGSAKWKTIDEMIAVLDRNAFWDDGFLSKSEEHAKKAYCRKMARALKAPEGHRVFASIITTDEDGTKTRVYKQELLFDPTDYRQCVSFWKGVGIHAMEEANGYARRAKKRFNVQIPLPFPTFEDESK